MPWPVWSVFLCHGLELGFEYAKTAPPSSITAGGGAGVFIRGGYLPAMRTGLYATPNPAAMMPAAEAMKPPISGEPKLMNPSPMTEATSVAT